ncbi:Gfo/Idh/MocA family protein [Cytobacillus sp. Hm23]
MKINVGIIGCGSITEFRHAPEYTNHPHVKDVFFYDRNLDRAKRLASIFNGKVVDEIEQLFKDPSIHAISDCSSNESHHIVTTQALLNDKHVLCEKPIANTISDAEKMIKAAKASGKILMIAQNQRFTKAHNKAKEIIHSGTLGKVLTFNTSFGHKGPEHWGVTKSNATWFFKKERSFIGVAGDLGIHKVDLLRYLLNDDIEEVSSFLGALHKKDEEGSPIEVCDNIVGILKTKKGALGTASFSWTYYGDGDDSTVIHLEKGCIKINHNPQFDIEITTIDGDKQTYQCDANHHDTNSGVINNFVDSIIHQRQPLVTGEDGLASLKVIMAMVKSAETRTVVMV